MSAFIWSGKPRRGECAASLLEFKHVRHNSLTVGCPVTLVVSLSSDAKTTGVSPSSIMYSSCQSLSLQLGRPDSSFSTSLFLSKSSCLALYGYRISGKNCVKIPVNMFLYSVYITIMQQPTFLYLCILT